MATFKGGEAPYFRVTSTTYSMFSDPLTGPLARPFPGRRQLEVPYFHAPSAIYSILVATFKGGETPYFRVTSATYSMFSDPLTGPLARPFPGRRQLEVPYFHAPSAIYSILVRTFKGGSPIIFLGYQH